MAVEKTVVRGLPDLKAALAGIVPKLRKRALRNALAAGARIVQRTARGATPVLRPGSLAIRRGVRSTGTVKKAISVRTSKLARRAGDVGVFVNVKPAKAGQRGSKSQSDPFYWRWLNFGWNPASRSTTTKQRRKMNKSNAPKIRAGSRFLEAGAARLGDALREFIRVIGPQIKKFNGGKDVQL